MVISEDVCDTSPFVPGRHFGQAKVEALPDLIADYVTNEEKRLAVVRAANELINGKLCLQNVVNQVIGIAPTENSAVEKMAAAQ